jgi:hypothetical protein
MIDISSLENAIEQLKESLEYAGSSLAKNNRGLAKQFRSSSIQAFEFTYELAHKTLKRYLEDIWKDYRHARSTTSHTYSEQKADDVFSRIPDFLEEAEFLRDQIKKRQSR